MEQIFLKCACYAGVIWRRLSKQNRYLLVVALSIALASLLSEVVILVAAHLPKFIDIRFALYGFFFASNYILIMFGVSVACSYMTVSDVAFIDWVTQVYTRRFFEAEIGIREAELRRNPQCVSCLFIDLNDFKKVNDKFGHAFGDNVLREAAAIIKQSVRESDIVARYGGDEFVVMLFSPCIQEMVVIEERLRTSLSAIRVKTEGMVVEISATVGGATCEGGFTPGSLTNLVKAADKRMYILKNQRN